MSFLPRFRIGGSAAWRRRHSRGGASISAHGPAAGRSAEALERILNSIAQPVIVKDRAHRFVLLNNAFCTLLGRSREELLGRSDHDFIPKEQADSFWAVDDEVFSTGEERQLTETITAGDGTLRTLLTHKCLVNLPGETGEQTFVVTTITDITQLRDAELALRESEEHYRYSVELNPQLPWTADAQANLLTGSSRWEALTGMPVDQALGMGWATRLHPDDLEHARERWEHSTSTGEPFDTEYRVRLVDGSYRWFRARGAPRFDGEGAIVRWYGTLEDIHDRKVAEEHLRWAAYHDELTGLPNRRLFQECLQEALAGGSASPHRVGLLILDLDHLKQINDTSGHDAGDALLKEFGQRLRRLVRTTDTVARLSGDEFAVILPEVDGEDDVAVMAQAILARIREPVVYDGKDLDCRTSIGGTVSSGHGTGPEELLKQADLALYSSKAAGRGGFAMFQPAMRDEAQKRASELEVARQAVALDWIEPFYQPKVDLRTGKLAGFEALLRWRHPRLGVQLPGALAQAFEEPELGVALGDRVLSRVVEDLRRWLDTDPTFGRISINASAAEFRRSDYAERVLSRLREASIPPDRIGVEVTETVLLDHNDGNVRKTLCALREGGISIALDDFGTGYASLSHLKQFPVDVIKIDRSFVSDLTTNVGDVAIVKAVLSLGQSLGIRVVAEGVETAAQASFLRDHGCDLGQGYLFGRPMPAGDVEQFVALQRERADHTSTWRD